MSWQDAFCKRCFGKHVSASALLLLARKCSQGRFLALTTEPVIPLSRVMNLLIIVEGLHNHSSSIPRCKQSHVWFYKLTHTITRSLTSISIFATTNAFNVSAAVFRPDNISTQQEIVFKIFFSWYFTKRTFVDIFHMFAPGVVPPLASSVPSPVLLQRWTRP